MSIKRDPTMEMRILLALEDHGEDTISKLSNLTGYSETALRSAFSILIRQRKMHVRQKNGVKVYGVEDKRSEV